MGLSLKVGGYFFCFMMSFGVLYIHIAEVVPLHSTTIAGLSGTAVKHSHPSVSVAVHLKLQGENIVSTSSQSNLLCISSHATGNFNFCFFLMFLNLP